MQAGQRSLERTPGEASSQVYIRYIYFIDFLMVASIPGISPLLMM